VKFNQFDLSGKRILVTGGTGFIGGRLVERLVLEGDSDVRVLVRNFAHASRIARFPIEMVHGDVTKPGDVERAVSDCEVVIHCAYGNSGSKEMQRLVNVAGTENVLAAALHAGVKRVVHLSTVAVYGTTPDGDLDETALRRYSGGVYADSKLDAENIALDYARRHGLPVAVLQPTVVYGPFAPVWTVNVLRQLKTGRMILVNGGNGLCNPVYVDDVVSAILLAAVKEEAVGEVFLISGEQPVTWRDFYGRYERMLGTSRTVSMSVPEAEAYYARKQRRVNGVIKETLSILQEEPLVRQRLLRTSQVTALMRIARLLLPKQIRQSFKSRVSRSITGGQSQTVPEGKKPIHLLDPSLVQFYAAKTRVRIDKAKRMLNYQPLFDFESGMELTEQWAKWANLLDD
jgi:nucleoside-diphosphate-sugar epimerase